MKSKVAVLGAVLLALAAAGAWAEDLLPLKKAGLWETKIKMAIPGMPQAHEMTTRICVDPASEEKQRAEALAKAKMDCTKAELRKTATGFVQDSVCKGDRGLTVTSHVEITGDFNSGYKMKTSTHMEGKDGKAQDTNMEMEAKWLGACPAGSVPGKMVMTK